METNRHKVKKVCLLSVNDTQVVDSHLEGYLITSEEGPRSFHRKEASKPMSHNCELNPLSSSGAGWGGGCKIGASHRSSEDSPSPWFWCVW